MPVFSPQGVQTFSRGVGVPKREVEVDQAPSPSSERERNREQIF